MPSSTVQAMPGPSRLPASTTMGGTQPTTLSHSRSSFSLRNFIAEDDGFTSAMLKSVDKDAFLAAQRQALAAFDDAALARALQASEQTAAEEARKRNATARPPTSEERAPPASSAPVQIPREPRLNADEEAARSLARSWRVDALQPALLDSTAIAIAAVSIPASSFTHAQSPSSASAYVTPHVSSSPPRENSRTDPSSFSARRPRAPSSAKPPSSYPSTSATRVEDMDIRARSAATDGYRSERSAPVAGPSTLTSTPSSSPPSAFTMTTSSSPPSHSRTHSRQPSGSNGPVPSSSSRRPRGPSVSADAHPAPPSSYHPPPTPSAAQSAHPRQDTPSMTASPIINTNDPSTKSRPPSRPIEKKVSASARDLRLGLTMTPTLATRPATRSRSQNISPEHEPSKHRDFFTASRRCSRCREVVKSPRSSPTESFSLRLLHATCATCSTNHCRGCFKPTRCPAHCVGGPSCTVRTCCAPVCAIALFEVLASFDKEYTAVAGSSTSTAEYIATVIARTDKKTRAFEGVLASTLRGLSTWLAQSSSSSSSSPSSDSSDLEAELHPSIARLFTISHLPSVMHAFLANTAERDWVVQSEIYLSILDVLKHLSACGLARVMKEPVRRVEASCGVQAWVWDRGDVLWAAAAGGGEGLALGDKDNASLGESVRGLEGQRGVLERYGEKFKSAVMGEKIGMLCEGISYLLLQQVVGGD